MCYALWMLPLLVFPCLWSMEFNIAGSLIVACKQTRFILKSHAYDADIVGEGRRPGLGQDDRPRVYRFVDDGRCVEFNIDGHAVIEMLNEDMIQTETGWHSEA